jgi:hypothetical protein
MERSPLLIDRLIELNACDGYVVLVVDPETGEADAHGPYDGLNATVVADRLRTDLDRDDLADVAVGVTRLYRPRP